MSNKLQLKIKLNSFYEKLTVFILTKKININYPRVYLYSSDDLIINFDFTHEFLTEQSHFLFFCH